MEHQREEEFAELRRRAEALLHGRFEEKGALGASFTPLPELIHELEVHQVELEMQNEELLQTEQRLEASKKQFSDLYNFAPVGYFTFDRKGTILGANLTGASLLGVERQSLIGTPFPAYCTPESADQFYLHVQSVLKTQHAQSCELILKNMGGVPFEAQVESVAARDAEGNFLLCQSALSDITARKRAQAEQLLQREMFTAIFESAPYIMVLVNQDGRVENINHAGLTFAGRPKRELLGLLGGDVFSCLNSFDGQGCGKNASCAQCPVRTRVMRAFETGEEAYNEEDHLAVRKDSREIILDLLISTTPVKTKESAFVLLTLIDISEQKKAEEERRKLEQQIQQTQKLESLGVLAGGIAHDFNNILTAVLGHAELALTEIPPMSAARESITEISAPPNCAARCWPTPARRPLPWNGWICRN